MNFNASRNYRIIYYVSNYSSLSTQSLQVEKSMYGNSALMFAKMYGCKVLLVAKEAFLEQLNCPQENICLNLPDNHWGLTNDTSVKNNKNGNQKKEKKKTIAWQGRYTINLLFWQSWGEWGCAFSILAMMMMKHNALSMAVSRIICRAGGAPNSFN